TQDLNHAARSGQSGRGAMQPTDPGFDTLPDRQVAVARADEQGRQVLFSVAAQSPAELADHDGHSGAPHPPTGPMPATASTRSVPPFIGRKKVVPRSPRSNPQSVYWVRISSDGGGASWLPHTLNLKEVGLA